jgi:hypothetical protein
VAPAEGALSARTVLEVADGLRWSDPRLGRSLAEHALRLAGDDAAARAAAERCVIRSLAEVDRFEEVVSRATPLLEDAAVRRDRDDLAGLLVELAVVAIGFGDDAVATRLVAPVRTDDDLPARTAVLAALVRAELAGATGDVAGADRAAQEADAPLGRTAEPEAGLVRRDLARARAAARTRSGEPGAALSMLSPVVSTDPGGDPDGGRRSLLAAADQVDVLLDLGRPDEALERGRAALPGAAAPPVVRPAARIRLALAERVHLVRGAHDEARSLARTAAEQLEDAGHEADAARAWEVVASAAERGGDLGAALTAVRHGHALESRSRDRRAPALRALATLAASAPELPARPVSAPPPAPEPAMSPDPAPAASSAPAPAPSVDPEPPVVDAPSSAGEGPIADVDGSEVPVRRRGHRRQDADDVPRVPDGESVPETLARLLGGSAVVPRSGAGASPSVDPDEGPESGRSGVADPGTNGLAQEGTASASFSSPTPRRHSGGPREDQLAQRPTEGESAAGVRPTFDAFSTAPGGRPDDDADVGRSGPGGEPSSPEPGAPDVERWDPDEFPHIDPADPLGSGTSRGTSGRPADAVAEPGRNGMPIDGPGRELGSRESGSPGSQPGVVGTGRSDDSKREALDVAAPSSPLSSSREPDLPRSDAARGTPLLGPPPASRSGSTGVERDELDDELGLTRAGLLAEYGEPDLPLGEGDRPADVAVPSARRPVAGAMPLSPTDQHFAAGPGDVPGRFAASPEDGAAGRRAPRGENGARLADLLAEAMDAFRHTAPDDASPGSADPARGNGDPTRGHGDRGRDEPARSNGDGWAEPARSNGDGWAEPGPGRGEGGRGPGIGTHRG